MRCLSMFLKCFLIWIYDFWFMIMSDLCERNYFILFVNELCYYLGIFLFIYLMIFLRKLEIGSNLGL